ncbi:MAG TPA: hypothetical protein VKY40_01995 [Halanaerobiales bacterium]|nr:hypothetical protein [Halanaerobiales bacterium]
MPQRISTAGIIAGVFTSTMLYFMESTANDPTSVIGSMIFVVAGGALLTYSLLTRETSRKYAMNRTRAAFYALSVGLMLFGAFTSTISYFEMNETYISVTS